MMTQKFEIWGGDSGAYGPVFGPVTGEETAEINQPPNEYLMVKLSPPLKVDQKTTEYMVVSPRYKGDTLKKLRRKRLCVGVFLVHEGKQDEVRSGVTNENVTYWAVGDCKPLK